MYDYFYGAQADQFSFIRIPTVLFSQEQFKNISPEAKVLYGILLKRMDLSAKNGWFDDQGRVYIICTLEEIMETLNCGNQKAVKLMDELERKIGLIELKRQGLGKPNLIYVKNFICPVDKVDNSSPSHFLKCENHTSGDVKITHQEVRKSHGSNTDNNDTDNRYTENPIYPGSDEEEMRARMICKSFFEDQIEYDYLLDQYPYERETIRGILDLLVDTYCSKRKYIRVAGDDKPADVVKSQIAKLNSSHIQYVMDCLKENTTDVRNIKQYLLAALYNAPTTISPYYQAKVNYDFYGNHD
ncbi:MAG: replication initiator protein A [Oscillospiraceae bacterium]|nr:replication initiator protein A [Oscillospiraceae bacterium]